MAQSVDFTVTRLDKNYIRITWDNTAGDTDWVYVDGIKQSSTPTIGATESYVKAKVSTVRTAAIDVVNSDIEPGNVDEVPGYLPVISWKSAVNAFRYFIYLDNVLVRTLVADSTKYVNKWQTTQHLADGWHYLRVVVKNKAGDQEDSKTKWFLVYTPGTPVTTITVSAGSGPGLYDIDLGV